MSAIVKTWVDGTITLKDGTGTPKTLAVTFDQGNFSVSGLKETLKETVAIESRGELVTLRQGKRAYPTGSFTCLFTEGSKGSGAANITDALTRKTGTLWADAVSTTVALGDVYTLDISFTVEGTNLGDSADHTFTLEDCDFQFDYAEGETGDTLSMSWTQYGATTGDIAAAVA
jgi:hypothetical protein